MALNARLVVPLGRGMAQQWEEKAAVAGLCCSLAAVAWLSAGVD